MKKHRRTVFPRSGFTLLEVIIAVALMGILFSLSVGVVVNVANLWDRSDSVATLDRHISGLDRFLSRLCEEQEQTELSRAGNASYVGTAWSVPAGGDGELYPKFNVKENYPIFQISEIPAPALTAWLFWDDAGLWLITQTPRQRLDGEDVVNFILLSEYLESATALGWDSTSESWAELERPISQEDVTKSVRLRLKFKQGKQERELTLTLSKAAIGGVVY